jgi:excisionase family DNA binding protein
MTTESIENKEVLSVSDIQHYLHISKDYAYSLVRSNTFPSIRIGNTYRIPKETFIHWLQYSAKNHLQIPI